MKMISYTFECTVNYKKKENTTFTPLFNQIIVNNQNHCVTYVILPS
jgi:hypothetical protein